VQAKATKHNPKTELCMTVNIPIQMLKHNSKTETNHGSYNPNPNTETQSHNPKMKLTMAVKIKIQKLKHNPKTETEHCS